MRVDLNGVQIAEERIVFGIHAHALSVLTVAKIRKAFNKVDSKQVAKQVSYTSGSLSKRFATSPTWRIQFIDFDWPHVSLWLKGKRYDSVLLYSMHSSVMKVDIGLL